MGMWCTYVIPIAPPKDAEATNDHATSQALHTKVSAIRTMVVWREEEERVKGILGILKIWRKGHIENSISLGMSKFDM